MWNRPDMHEIYPNIAILSDDEEVSNQGNKDVGDHRSLVVNVVGCNSTRRSTCKPKEEIEAFLRTS